MLSRATLLAAGLALSACSEPASGPATYLPDTTVRGDLDGDGDQDEAVLYTLDQGGSGTFVYLAAFLNQGGETKQADSVFLEDRPKIQKVYLQGRTIVVEAIVHAENDPMCCPTKQARLEFIVNEQQHLERKGP